jgi:hypothetical protein
LILINQFHCIHYYITLIFNKINFNSYYITYFSQNTFFIQSLFILFSSPYCINLLPPFRPQNNFSFHIKLFKASSQILMLFFYVFINTFQLYGHFYLILSNYPDFFLDIICFLFDFLFFLRDLISDNFTIKFSLLYKNRKIKKLLHEQIWNKNNCIGSIMDFQ